MATTPTQSLIVGQYVLVTVSDFKEDGQTLDSVETLQLSSSPTGIAGVSLVTGNPRQVKITALASGSATVNITAANVPASSSLYVPIAVNNPPPNLSRVELVQIDGPF